MHSGQRVLPRNCVYGTRPVSAQPLGAITVSCQCMLAHRTKVQAHLVNTWQEQLGGMPVNYCYHYEAQEILG